MTADPKCNAIVYCEGAFGTTNGNTAHGLIRYTNRYNILSVVDSRHNGKDAGVVLNGKSNNIPIFGTLQKAINNARKNGNPATHFVMGLTPDGGKLSHEVREEIIMAISYGLNIDSGLHDFLSEDFDLKTMAIENEVKLRDIRKPPNINELHFFSGKIEEVTALKVAYLGTDSAVGKRTSALILTDELRKKGYKAEMIGTGQTSWLQGVKYSIIFDSLINDFVSGEIEHIVWKAWKETAADVIVIEGQGSIMNPAYPGGFEILAAARPDLVILQHAPTRLEYDGFPGFPLHPIEKQIQVIELLSDIPVVAITINHEGIPEGEISNVCKEITEATGLPTFDLLISGADELVNRILTSS
jgi:uncharacterized NAD-dependent epimerase/dehydratase family protein